MSMNRYEPTAVYENIVKMLAHRGATLKSPGVAPADIEKMMTYAGHITINAERGDGDIRGPAHLHVILIAPDSAFAASSTDFKKLLRIVPRPRSDGGRQEIIFVSQRVLSKHIDKAILEWVKSRTNTRVETHPYIRFIIDITRHVLVPRHEIASEEDVVAWCKRHHTAREYFPSILDTDPQAIWLGLRPGMCARVYRRSETSGEFAGTFRFCVSQSASDDV